MDSIKRPNKNQLIAKIKKKCCDGCGKMPTKETLNNAIQINQSHADFKTNLLSFCLTCSFEQSNGGWKRFLSDKPFLVQKLAQMGWRIGGDGKLIRY